ncbi:hypothetical protein CRYUN_Cryun09bG0143700 [Craigia yunnanensis]
MKRVFGVKKDKEPPLSIQDASDRINKRGDTVDEKLKKLDAELSRYKEQIKKTRPGPAQEATKARAMRALKQKRMYEGQRAMLYNQTFKLDQVAFASKCLKDAQQTFVPDIKCLFHAIVDLLGPRYIYSKTFLFLGSTRRGTIQDNSGGAFSVPLLESAAYLMRNVSPEICQQGVERNDEDSENLRHRYEMMDLMDVKLDALEADMGSEADGVPSYLQPEKDEPDLDAELNLPSALTGNTAAPAGRSNAQSSLSLSSVPVFSAFPPMAIHLVTSVDS